MVGRDRPKPAPKLRLGRADEPASIEQANTEASIEEAETAASIEEAETAASIEELDASAAGPLTSGVREGTKIGRFVALGRLGEGGMGVVLAAFDPLLDRKVAVKLLRPQATAAHTARQARQRLIREARAMAKLAHPNVLPVFEAGEFGSSVFVAMEYNDGETLDEWVRGRKRSWREVLEVFVEAGKGLAAAHQAELVHRDFKPENVLISEDGRVRVADFGLVRSRNDALHDEDARTGTAPGRPMALTQTGEVMGTPLYMAPEQHLGQETDARTDQFSYCAALYQMLYGERAFAGESYRELVDNVVRGRVGAAPTNSKVPPWVRAILLRGLSPAVEDRFPSMNSLLAELARDPARKRRQRLVMAAVACAFAALASVAFFGLTGKATRAGEPCALPPDALAGVWDDEVKSRVKAAFLATGRPNAEHTYGRLEGRVDDYVEEWIAMRQETCAATEIRGEQPQEVMHVRLGCLARRLNELQALTEVFARGGGDVLASSFEALVRLTPISSCADVETLELIPRPDPSIRDTVERLRRQLDRANALHMTGQYDEGVAVAARVVEESSALDYAPLRAEALTQLGVLQQYAFMPEEAERTLRAAAKAAAEAHDDYRLAVAWMHMVYVVGWELPRYDDALDFIPVAEAAVARVGDNPVLEAEFLAILATTHYAQGKHDEARKCALRGLALEERLGAGHYLLGTHLNVLGLIALDLGRYDETRRYYERTWRLWKESLGANHPWTNAILNNMGELANAQGDHTRALDYCQRSLAIDETTLGPSHPEIAFQLTCIGIAQLGLGQPEAALETLERATRLRPADQGSGADLAETRFATARALWETGRDRKRALELASQAEETFRSLGAARKRQLTEVEAWLESRR